MEIKPTSECVLANEFSKTFKIGETDLYVAKAYDEDSDGHFLIFSIPSIKEVEAVEILYPMMFPSEEERDAEFSSFGIEEAEHFLLDLTDIIKENNKKMAKEAEKIAETKLQ
jgi:hypothetical protein